MSTNSLIYLERNTTISLRINESGDSILRNQVQLVPSDTSTGVRSQHTTNVRNS